MLSLMIFCSCDLFRTRNPEDPGGGNSTQWVFPSDPSTVLTNLETSFGRRSSVDYMRSFISGEDSDSSFEFVPSQETAAIAPSVFENWDVNRERQFIESLFNSANLPLDSLGELDIIEDRKSVIGSEADLSADYEANIGHVREGTPREIAGRMEVHLARENDGGWYIQRWIDFKVADKACWSDLKVNF